jgi:hypothetical protein
LNEQQPSPTLCDSLFNSDPAGEQRLVCFVHSAVRRDPLLSWFCWKQRQARAIETKLWQQLQKPPGLEGFDAEAGRPSHMHRKLDVVPRPSGLLDLLPRHVKRDR